MQMAVLACSGFVSGFRCSSRLQSSKHCEHCAVIAGLIVPNAVLGPVTGDSRGLRSLSRRNRLEVPAMYPDGWWPVHRYLELLLKHHEQHSQQNPCFSAAAAPPATEEAWLHLLCPYRRHPLVHSQVSPRFLLFFCCFSQHRPSFIFPPPFVPSPSALCTLARSFYCCETWGNRALNPAVDRV